MQFAKRPVKATNVPGKGGVVQQVALHKSLVGKNVSLLTNYYRFEFANPEKKKIFKYHVKFTPEISDNSKKMRCKLVNGLRT